MKANVRKNLRILKRKRRVRGKISGTGERPRLCVYKSLRHIYAQLIDDEKMVTLASVSTLTKDIVPELAGKPKIDAARTVGEKIAKIGLEKGFKRIAFDRNGTPYHGRVKALAEAARKAGLEF